MSDNISFEIQMEIIERIPDIKWVIQYRSVSKAWKSMIDSKDFVTAHTRRHQAHNHHLLISTQDCSDCTGDIRSGHCDHCNYTPLKFFSIVDDDVTFPHQKVSVLVPDSVEELFSPHLSGSHGLFCLYEYGEDTALIWNPCIRKTVAIAVPNVLFNPQYITVFGFGVCSSGIILEPKLVKITYVNDSNRLQDVNDASSTQVEVYTLSSGGRCWRSPLSRNVPDKSIRFGDCQAVVDGFIYWDAVDRINVDDDRFRNTRLIMSFDLTSEEFTKVNLPGSLALYNPDTRLSLYDLRESLVVLEKEFSRKIFHVWVLVGHGCSRSFNKIYSINASPDAASIHSILGFRNTGAPIIEVDNDKEHYYEHERTLAVYDPESKSNTNIGIYGLYGNFFVHSYMETLLLLGHRDIGV